MPTPTSSQNEIKNTEQSILNRSFDPDFQVLVAEGVAYDGSVLKRVLSGSTATKIVISGTDIYVGKAPIGSATSAAVWQVKKIDTASPIVIKWADGNDSFDNVMDNAASLSYS